MRVRLTKPPQTRRSHGDSGPSDECTAASWSAPWRSSFRRILVKAEANNPVGTAMMPIPSKQAAAHGDRIHISVAHRRQSDDRFELKETIRIKGDGSHCFDRLPSTARSAEDFRHSRRFDLRNPLVSNLRKSAQSADRHSAFYLKKVVRVQWPVVSGMTKNQERTTNNFFFILLVAICTRSAFAALTPVNPVHPVAFISRVPTFQSPPGSLRETPAAGCN
jgi:hypothetical protein